MPAYLFALATVSQRAMIARIAALAFAAFVAFPVHASDRGAKPE
jgi:hypothetical protein